MSTRGAITFVADGVEKTVYNHSDSYPGWLGVQILEWLRSGDTFDVTAIRAQVENLQMVDDQSTPSAEEWERFAQYADTGVSSGDNWYALLRRTQGDPAAILNAGVACDANGFPLGSLFCEWAYVIDLDKMTLEVYKGFQESRPTAGRWVTSESSADRAGKYWPVNLVQSWTIDELRASQLSGEAIMGAVEESVEESDD